MSLYMANVVVPNTDSAWEELCENSNAWKGLLWRLFSHAGLPENEGGYVFRETIKKDVVKFFLMSSHQPDVKAYGRRPITVEMREVNTEAFCPGAKFRFLSRFSPQRRRADGKRVLIRDAEVPKWLGRQIFKAATLVESRIIKSGIREGYKDEQVITHPWVDVEGILMVDDTQLFVEKLVTGVGRGKRYGLGMIVLRPN